MEVKLDMENRDPQNINDHLKMRFEDVFGEPASVRSIDCAWSTAYSCYTCCLSCCYNVLAILCGVPMAIFWGCTFAQLACYHIWYLTPYLRQYLIELALIRKFLEACLGALVGPFCTTCGLCLSKIEVKHSGKN